MADLMTYDENIQELFIRFMISDSDLFSRSQTILKAEYFSKKFQPTVDLMISYSRNYSRTPTIDQIYAITQLRFELITPIHLDHQTWFLDEFEVFCRHKALEHAIISSTDLLAEHQYGAVELIIKEASQVSLIKDLGLDYFEDPKRRLDAILAKGGGTSTGWKDIDEKLYGGVNRGEITIFAGGSGSGKSLLLQNLALNWVAAGLNVVYISLELSEDMISLRLDAMTTGYSTRQVIKNISDVHLRVRAAGKKSGALRVKQMPNGVNANDIRAFIREYEIQTGITVDAILVDYLDLMSPISNKVSPSDLFVKDKYVTEELRNLAVERNFLCATASQLGRSAVEEIEFNHSHIAGGISKIQTADNVIGIFTSAAMKERGRFQVQFMKTRSSSGEGSKVDLAFSNESLRISDLPEGEQGSNESAAAGMLASLNRKKVAYNTDEGEKPDDTVSSAMNLREFLKSPQNGK